MYTWKSDNQAAWCRRDSCTKWASTVARTTINSGWRQRTASDFEVQQGVRRLATVVDPLPPPPSPGTMAAETAAAAARGRRRRPCSSRMCPASSRTPAQFSTPVGTISSTGSWNPLAPASRSSMRYVYRMPTTARAQSADPPPNMSATSRGVPVSDPFEYFWIIAN